MHRGAGHLGCVSVEARRQHLAQAVQADEARAQGVECGQVAAEAGVVEVGGQDAGVLAQDVHGLPAEGFGFVAHFGQLAALVGGECEQGAQLGVQSVEGAVDGIGPA